MNAARYSGEKQAKTEDKYIQIINVTRRSTVRFKNAFGLAFRGYSNFFINRLVLTPPNAKFE